MDDDITVFGITDAIDSRIASGASGAPRCRVAGNGAYRYIATVGGERLLGAAKPVGILFGKTGRGRGCAKTHALRKWIEC